MTVLLILLAIIVILAIIVASSYNKVQKMNNNIDEAESQIDVQLQRRADLIPNLVATVKGYAKFENKTLKDVISQRNSIVSADTIGEKLEADKKMTSQLSGIFAISEQYPDLKANQSFLNLQEELTATENKVGYSRQLYNSCVNTYNSAITTIPTNIIASLFHFNKREYLKADSEARKAVKVEF